MNEWVSSFPHSLIPSSLTHYPGLGARGWRKNEPTYLTLLPVLRPCPAVQSTERRGDREKGWDGKRHLSIHSIFLPFPLVAFITSNSHKLATNEGKGKLLSRNALLIPLPYLSVPCHVTHQFTSFYNRKDRDVRSWEGGGMKDRNKRQEIVTHREGLPTIQTR